MYCESDFYFFVYDFELIIKWHRSGDKNIFFVNTPTLFSLNINESRCREIKTNKTEFNKFIFKLGGEEKLERRAKAKKKSF